MPRDVVGDRDRSGSPVLSGAALTTRDVPGAVALAFVVGALIDQLGAVLPIVLSRGAAVVAAVMVIFFGIRLWGRDMARIAQRSETAGMSNGRALALASLVGLMGLTLGLVEPLAVSRGARSNLRIDQV